MPNLGQSLAVGVGGADPSIVLSTYSFERMRTLVFKERVELLANAAVTSVTQDEEGFSVHTADGQNLHTPVPPLFAGGFDGSLKLVSDLFEQAGRLDIRF